MNGSIKKEFIFFLLPTAIFSHEKPQNLSEIFLRNLTIRRSLFDYHFCISNAFKV